MKLKIIPIWLSIFLLSSYIITIYTAPGICMLDVLPKAPRKDEPILAFYKLMNPTSVEKRIFYTFHINGKGLKKGSTLLPPYSSKTYQYVYSNPLKMGENINFAIETTMDGKTYTRQVSIPPYPPQIMSSFVSFASFSSSMMESMASSTYYFSVFQEERGGWDPGLAISITLIAILIYIEFTDPSHSKTPGFLKNVREKYTNLAWVLFIIFIGLVYTRIALILMG
jgi:hypothetical protein